MDSSVGAHSTLQNETESLQAQNAAPGPYSGDSTLHEVQAENFSPLPLCCRKRRGSGSSWDGRQNFLGGLCPFSLYSSHCLSTASPGLWSFILLPTQLPCICLCIAHSSHLLQKQLCDLWGSEESVPHLCYAKCTVVPSSEEPLSCKLHKLTTN